MRVKLNGNSFFEVSSQYGALDSVHKTPHSGIDLVMDTGTKLFSPVDGVVTKVVDYGSENIGKGIIIKTDSGESVIMGHLSHASVSEGQSIQQGDFVALSGNTGHSTGSHLHLGLRDAGGHFTNPEKLISNDFISNGKINNYKDLTTDKSFWQFINDWREEGFWVAMYDKPFFEVCKDFIGGLFHDIGLFLLGYGDLIFLLPAVGLMFATFAIGRNRYTKWILPLWFAYFVTSVFYKLLLAQ